MNFDFGGSEDIELAPTEEGCKIHETQRPWLADDRPRFWNIVDGPVFFPTSPDMFHLGSYDALLVKDTKRLTGAGPINRLIGLS